jgi:hypothetical protein
MKRVKALLVLLLCTPLTLALGSYVTAGSGTSQRVRLYEGQITAIKIDKCGLKPGTCEGSITLATADGGQEVTLVIKPRTWLRRGDQFVTIDELSVGNYVKVEAVQLPGELLLRWLYVF